MGYLFSETKAQLRYDTLIVYNSPVYDGKRSKHHRLKLASNFKDAKTYSGIITHSTKKRISRAINIMLQSLEKQTIYNPITKRKEIFKINFTTLTISGKERKVTPKEGYSLLLKPFIQWLTKTIGVKTYIWKAELQKNGQLHYHITTNTWIHWQLIRNKWNYLLAKNGLLDAYYKEHKHTNANSTDVHKVYKIKNIAAYLHKELTKTVQNENPTNGKLWDCSNNLKGQKYFEVYFDETHEKLLYAYSQKAKLTELTTDNCTIIKGNRFITPAMLTPKESNDFARWITSIRRANTLDF